MLENMCFFNHLHTLLVGYIRRFSVWEKTLSCMAQKLLEVKNPKLSTPLKTLPKRIIRDTKDVH